MGAEVPSLRARWLGAKLAELRLKADLKSLAAAADKAGRSTASLSRIENGIVYLPPRDLPPILDAYGVTDGSLREKLLVIAMEIQEERRGWWLDHDDVLSPSYLDLIRLEATAKEIQTYETHFIPGLLQTEAYASAAATASWEAASPQDLNEFVSIRMNRQKIFARDVLVRLRVILSEAVLRHPVGGQQIFRDQLLRLGERAAAGEIALQVLPFGGQPHPGMAGAFTVLRLPSLDIVHVELMNSDAYIEDDASVAHYMTAFEQLSRLAATPDESEQLIAEAASRL